MTVCDWIASSLAAGVQDGADPAFNAFFGDGDDQGIAGGNPAIVSKIASITIKGQALATIAAVNNTDHFGIVAQQIGSFKAGGTKFPLTPGPANDLAGALVGATADLRVCEVAL